MTAKQLVEANGKKLIGLNVMTKRFGEYPGGVAEVIEIEPDPESPEIVFQVRHPNFGEIGVFEFESVELCSQNAPAQNDTPAPR